MGLTTDTRYASALREAIKSIVSLSSSLFLHNMIVMHQKLCLSLPLLHSENTTLSSQTSYQQL